MKQSPFALALSRVCGQQLTLGTYRQIQSPKPQKSSLDLHWGIKLDICPPQRSLSHCLSLSSLICPETVTDPCQRGGPVVSISGCICVPSITETKCSEKPGGGILLLAFLKFRSLAHSHYSSLTTWIKSCSKEL